MIRYPVDFLGSRVVRRESDIREIEHLRKNKVHTNQHRKLTFMLFLCRHRERVCCSPRSRTGIEIIPRCNALTLAVRPAIGSRRAQNASRRTWDFCWAKGALPTSMQRNFGCLAPKWPGSGLCSLTCPPTCQPLGAGLAGGPL